MKKYCIYILKSRLNNRYYVGATDNIERRLNDHNTGKVSSTKHAMPWSLKYQESYPDLSSARVREFQIKNWKKRSAVEKLINGPIV